MLPGHLPVGEHEDGYRVAKLSKALDRGEWRMTLKTGSANRVMLATLMLTGQLSQPEAS